MKKAIVCGVALAGFAWLGGGMMNVVPVAAQAVEEQNNYRAVTSEDFVENADVFAIASLKSGQVTEEYRLAKYDTIAISILDLPGGMGYTTGSTKGGDGDLLVIGPDGYAALPYVGKVQLAGLTLDEATAVIRDKLSRYIRITDMYVSVKSYGPRKVYVMGEVNNPGVHNLGIDNLNTYAAIASAGGYTIRGRSTRVQVIRVVDDTMYYRQLNMKDFVRKHDLTQNVALQDGDIVYVPKSDGIRWKEDIMPILSGWYYVKRLID